MNFYVLCRACFLAFELTFLSCAWPDISEKIKTICDYGELKICTWDFPYILKACIFFLQLSFLCTKSLRWNWSITLSNGTCTYKYRIELHLLSLFKDSVVGVYVNWYVASHMINRVNKSISKLSSLARKSNERLFFIVMRRGMTNKCPTAVFILFSQS